MLRKSYLLLAPTNQCAELIKYFGLHVKDKVNAVLAGIPSDRTVGYRVTSMLDGTLMGRVSEVSSSPTASPSILR